MGMPSHALTNLPGKELPQLVTPFLVVILNPVL